MQFLLMFHADETRWTSMPEGEQQYWIAEYGKFHEAITAAGAYLGSNRLRPTSTGRVLRMANGKPQVLDGPYAESKEQIGGYFLIEVANLEAALDWAARCPAALHGAVEVRPVWLRGEK